MRAFTSPPYFNAKMYAREPLAGDLGDIHDLDEWLDAIGVVWREVFRTLQSGTTLLAAAMLERNGVGYEINPEIARGAVARLQNTQLTMEI